MKIKNVALETVCGITSRFPKNEAPEFAFVGRSNVGKSSLINALMMRKSLRCMRIPATICATPAVASDNDRPALKSCTPHCTSNSRAANTVAIVTMILRNTMNPVLL